MVHIIHSGFNRDPGVYVKVRWKCRDEVSNGTVGLVHPESDGGVRTKECHCEGCGYYLPSYFLVRD